MFDSQVFSRVEILATREAFYQHEKIWVVWGLFAEIEIWTFFC